METLKDLTPEERIIKECYIRAANIILHGLPNDNYNLLNHKKNAYEIWYKMKELMEGTQLTKQERESNFTNEFDRFTLENGETLQSYYMSFKQLYAYLKQNEPVADKVRAMKARFPDPLALIENTYNPPPYYLSYKSQYNPSMSVAAQQQTYIPQPSYKPLDVYQQPPVVYQQLHVRPTSSNSRFVVPTFSPTDDPIASLNKEIMFLPTAISSRYLSINNQLRTSSNPRTQANIQDGRVVVQNAQGKQSQGYTEEGRYAKQCTTKKRVKDSKWFKEKMLLAQQQEVGIKIDVEQQDFLAGGLEGFDSDCDDLQLNATYILMTKKVDAYDTEVDDAPTASVIFMTKLSPVGSINGDEISPSYDSYILSEVPNYDTYNANDMFNPFV
nr:hypothetical protein [Tanacetum cinerariifolium]